MTMTTTLDELLQPLFAVLPLERAMGELLPQRGAGAEAVAVVRQLVAEAPLRENLAAQAALWLYVDELDRSHTISQGIHDATGSFLHGIMHRREGDFSNSHYWMHRAGSHPVWKEIPGYDPEEFIDAVDAARGQNPAELVALQRREWVAVMAYCLR